jgi:RNA polymerase sigma factor (sigma-70 family)
MSRGFWIALKDPDIPRAREGLARIVQANARLVDQVLRRLLGLQESDLKEVTQELWTKNWQKREQLRIPEPGSETAWIIRVARNVAADLFRKQGRVLLLIDPEESPEQAIDPNPGPDELAAECELACDAEGHQESPTPLVQRVRELIDELDRNGQVIVDAYCKRESENWRVEVASRLGITPNYVGVLFDRIKKRIKETLEDEGLI